jgi:hypothetical protein
MMLDTLPHGASVDDARAIGHSVNVATGRGGGRKGSKGIMLEIEKMMPGMNKVLLASRFYLARFQALLLQPLYSGPMSGKTRKMIAANYAKTVSARTAVYGLLLLAFGKADDDDDFDDEEEEEEVIEEFVDDEELLKLAVDATKQFIKESTAFSDKDLVEYVTNQQMASALKSHDKLRILVQAAFSKSFFKKNEIELFSPAIRNITNGNRIMERHLIAALEAHNIKRPKNLPIMMKQLYDQDTLEEDTILEWADQGRSEYTLECVDEETRAELRAEAEPLVTWLQGAESEEDSEESESS